jgi:hypothetical protein
MTSLLIVIHLVLMLVALLFFVSILMFMLVIVSERVFGSFPAVPRDCAWVFDSVKGDWTSFTRFEVGGGSAVELDTFSFAGPSDGHGLVVALREAEGLHAFLEEVRVLGEIHDVELDGLALPRVGSKEIEPLAATLGIGV